MLPKFFAFWLVVLVVSPFTAPCSTCDLASLFANAHGQHIPIAPPVSRALTTDAAVPSFPFIRVVGRVKLLPLSRVSRAESLTVFSSPDLVWSLAASGSISDHVALTTNLRL
jgi:hypothetical protein